jgi:hypothetical protein
MFSTTLRRHGEHLIFHRTKFIQKDYTTDSFLSAVYIRLEKSMLQSNSTKQHRKTYCSLKYSTDVVRNYDISIKIKLYTEDL